MFTKKETDHELSRDQKIFFLVQRMATIIAQGDLTSESMPPFYDILERLQNLGVITHEATKNSASHVGLVVSATKTPLVFFAVMYNRKSAFEALTGSFHGDIANLKDGMRGKKWNILHHMYGPDSLADEVMQEAVFKYLEKCYSSKQILAMIRERDPQGFNVFRYAQSYGYGFEALRERIGRYQMAEEMQTLQIDAVAANGNALFAPPQRTPSVDAAAQTLTNMLMGIF